MKYEDIFVKLREGTAVLLLSHYGVPMEAAIAAAFSLFVINFLLPSLVGLVLSPTLAKAHEEQKKVGEGEARRKDRWTELKGLFHASRPDRSGSSERDFTFLTRGVNNG